jgi:hypothetical protein
MDGTIENEVRLQVARELEKSMSLKSPGGRPDYDEVTNAINAKSNTELLWYISEAIGNNFYPA